MTFSPETRIAFRPALSVPARKLTKITSYRNGGFGILMPYHSAKSGFLAKIPVDYNHVGTSTVSFSDMLTFTATDRVKLSYHPDGFAQFSGEVAGKIISGRNPDGTIKGLGLITSPLTNPISTGPTFAIGAWGESEFEEVSADEEAMIFEGHHLYYRGCTPDSANGWLLEAFVFPERYWASVRAKDDGSC